MALGFFVVTFSTVLYLPNRNVTVYYPSSDVVQWQGSIKWGAANGLWQYWHPDDTQQALLHWVKGRREGSAEFYNPDGSISGEESYLHDLLHGPARYYGENGRLVSEGEYSYGWMSGPWKPYDETGQLLSEGSYYLDRPTGHWRYWFPEGITASHGQYEQGKLVGVWEYYYKGGKLQRICEYDTEGNERILSSWAPDESVEVSDGNGHYCLYGDEPGVILLEGPVINGDRV